MLTPEEIDERRFLVSLRGYDRDEVHAFLNEVAAQVGELQRRNEELTAELKRVRGELAEGAAAPVDEGEQEGESVAEESTRRPFAAVGEETQRILEAAQEAGNQITRKARQDADRELQAARQRAAKLIADGERRREAIERVVADLEARRDDVVGGLRSIEQTIAASVAELAERGPAAESPDDEPSAESAGDEAPAEAPTELDAVVEDVADAAVASGREEGAELERVVTQGPLGEAAGDLADDAGVVEGDGGQELPAGEGSELPASLTARLGEGEWEEPSWVRHDRPAGEAQPAEAGEALEGGPGEVAERPPADGEGVDPAEAGDGHAVGEATEGLAGDDAMTDQGGADEGGADEEAADAGPSAPAAVVEPVRQPEPAAPDEEQSTRRGAIASAAQAAQGAASDGWSSPEDLAGGAEPPRAAAQRPRRPGPGGSSPGSLRTRALEPLHPKLLRRVKRGLSDLQNIALDRVRREGATAAPEALELRDDELAALGEAAGELLEQAYAAGVAAAAVLAGRDLEEPTVERDFGEAFVADGGARVREPLAATLRMGISSEESLSSLNDRVGAVFSELKSAAADELSATHLIKAYETGLLDAWAASGIARRAWVLGREQRCPEGRCRQNDQNGAVSVTEAFPSGHHVPPIHVGCTCTTIPSPES